MVTAKQNRCSQSCQDCTKEGERDTIISLALQKIADEQQRQREQALLVNQMENLRVEQEAPLKSLSNDAFDFSSIKQSLQNLENKGVNRKKCPDVQRKIFRSEAIQMYHQIWLHFKQMEGKTQIESFHRKYCLNVNDDGSCFDLEKYGDQIFEILEDVDYLNKCFEYLDQEPDEKTCVSRCFLLIMYSQLKETYMKESMMDQSRLHNIQFMLEKTEEQLILLNQRACKRRS